jgi:uncharacterized C2H2 Zn-finger protein
MQSDAYKCDICSMVFVNSEELAKHKQVVHIKKMYQCQSCNKFFTNKQEFEKHEIEVHGENQYNSDRHYYSNTYSSKTTRRRPYKPTTKINEVEEEKGESALLNKTNKEKKARRRTRGPYRKSSSPI